MKYIFVTGGVVSSLGKGLAAASLGTLLELRGLRVVLQKFDPYLNVDPGTMNPFQHGEVYVLNDGAETDLDLGHYERFTNCVLSRHNNLTSGQVYESVILKGAPRRLSRQNRAGDSARHRRNQEPHSRDLGSEESRRRHHGNRRHDGDIEGLPFLEAIRQFILEVGPQNVVERARHARALHQAARELKTKPTQQSIAKLREIGLQPQVLICRTEHPLDAEVRQKLSMFCNVSPQRGDRGARRQAHDLRDAADAARGRARRSRLRVAPDRRATAEPDELAEIRRARREPEETGQDRGRRQIHRSAGRVQEHLRIAHARGREPGLRDRSEIDRRGNAQDGVDGQLKDVAGVLIPGRFRRARRGRKNQRGAFCARKQGSLSRPLSRHAGGDDRVRTQRLRNRKSK